ncbi:sulfotransferase [Coleofasciculus sp. E1-EBD-02]|uniref:sulfotransferase n=1 Tax=Coleofasciculus sp. E1-EBD-02 TaxID=3068481 RepID=UPI0032F8969C
MHWIPRKVNKLNIKRKTESLTREAQSRIVYPIDWFTASKIDISKCLLINGFWRSGTTWLQEILSAATNSKTVFEPFAARAGYLYKAIPEIHPPQRERTFLDLLMPYQEHNFREGSHLKHIVRKALLGLLPHRHTRRTIRPISYYSRDRVVVKFVRASLCLKAIYNDFPCPIIHLYRDPRAVISSIKRKPGWGDGAFDKLSIAKQLLEINDGREKYFSKWKNEILELDKQNLTVRLAVYWTLTEKYMLDSFHNQHNRFYVVNYEDMICEGSDYLKKILEQMKIPFNDLALEEKWKIPSSTAYKRQNLKDIDRLYSWKSAINQLEQDAIMDIMKIF